MTTKLTEIAFKPTATELSRTPMTLFTHSKELARTDHTMIDAPNWLDKTLFPFQHCQIEIEGNQLHYIDEGQGPVLLFLHASPAWSFLYRDIIMGLKSRFRCIALDYPGFGLSPLKSGWCNTLTGNSRLVERFIMTLGLTDVTLYVHDASCAIGLGVIARRRPWFRAAIISNSFAWPLDEFPHIVRFLRIVGSRPFGFLINRFDFFTRYFTRSLKGGQLTQAEKAAYRGPFQKRANRHVQQELFQSIVESHDYLVDLEQRLLILDQLPALLIFGTDDETYKAGWLERFEQLFPRHRSLILEGADHFPQEHDPQRIVSEICTWWDTEMEVHS